MHLARQRIADAVAAALVRPLVDEEDAVRQEPFEGGDGLIGEGTHDFAVVVAVIGKAVRPHDGPVGEIAEEQVGRVWDAVFPLHAGAAAQRHVAAADHGVAADMVLGLDQDHLAPGLARDDRRRHAARARPHHHHVRLMVPAPRQRARAE